MKILWICSQCGLKVTLEENEFPIHCRCGNTGFPDESQPLPELPSLPQLAKNFAKATVRDVKAGFKRLTEEQYKKRLSICKVCDYVMLYNGEPYRCKHKSCGCFLSRKAWRVSESCPMGYWPKE